MALLTLNEVQNSRAIEIADATSTSKQFISLVNAATRQLMQRGNWFGTLQPMQGCIYDGCIVWPRRVAAVLALNTECGGYSQPANRWYRFMDWSNRNHFYGLYQNWRHGGRRFVNISDGSLPVFNPIPCGQLRFVRFYVTASSDVGKTIVIYGKDNNGQVLAGTRSDGTYQDGLVLTLTTPYVQSPVPLESISRVVKDPTSGRVRGYQVDGNGVQYDMALYDPSEISPDYVRTRLPHRGGRDGMISALVKLAYVPVVYPDDEVLIENLDALRDMMFSIKKKEAGDLASAAALERSAMRELNYEMRTRFPDEQFIVNFKPFGNDELNNYRNRVGTLI